MAFGSNAYLYPDVFLFFTYKYLLKFLTTSTVTDVVFIEGVTNDFKMTFKKNKIIRALHLPRLRMLYSYEQ